MVHRTCKVKTILEANMNKKTREQAIEELSLMLMYLTRSQDNNEFCRYMETSWKSYDFNALDELEKKHLLYQPRKSKCVYLSEEGKAQARELLDEYQVADKDILEKYEFRSIRPEEADEAAAIEQICFPPNEAPELFLVAVDRSTGRLAGFLNGLATDEYTFRDEFFTDANLYNPDGKNIMLLGLDVLPEYRRQGIAKELVYSYARRGRENGKQMLILTCLRPKAKMYEKMGFVDKGIANSTWGGEEWHEMVCRIGC
jgi:GNAT superfamily N-acetyltransferase